MVRGNVADIRQTAPAKPEIGVIIVQIRDLLARTAAKFSDIVARGAAGYQREIDRVADTLAYKSDCPDFDYCTTAPLIDLISLRFSPPRMDNVLIKVDSSKLSKGGDAWQTTAPQGL